MDDNSLVQSRKGTNGVMDGHANVQKFRAWMATVEDFKPYVYQGALNVSKMAREAGLNRDVFFTNSVIRDELVPNLETDLEREGVLKARAAQPAQVVIRDRSRSPANDARVKQIQEENEALKAENRELRAQLERFKGMAEVLRTSGRLPW